MAFSEVLPNVVFSCRSKVAALYNARMHSLTETVKSTYMAVQIRPEREVLIT
jgi:hypothetical protein